MEYDLKTMKPSQERRLVSALKTEQGRTEFIRKLRNFLSDAPTGGEAELDQTTSLAIRLTALGAWDELPVKELNSVSESGNRDRLAAFCKGMPSKMTPYLQILEGSKSRKVNVGGSKRDELIAKYADDLRRKVGVEPDMDLLTKVTIGCGPSIYNRNLETISTSQLRDLEKVRDNFLVGKLGLPDSPKLMTWVTAVVNDYGWSDLNEYKAVFYYLLIDRLSQDESTVRWVKEHSTEEETPQNWLIRS